MRVGIIGCGYISTIHARAIASLGHELVVVADINEERARSFGAAHDCKWTTSNAALLAADLDIVIIAVPIPAHSQVVREALESHHPILCEKPLTRSAKDSRTVVEMVKDRRAPFFVGYMKRAHPTMQRFKEYAARIGTPRSGLVRCYHPFSPGVSWKTIAEAIARDPNAHAQRDGALRVSTCHMLDLLLQCAGPVRRVLAARFQYRPGCPGMDTATHGLLEMENGSTVMVECGWVPLHGVGRREDGFDEFVELRGDEGLAKVYTTMWYRPEHESPVAELWYEPTSTREKFNAGSVNYFVRQIEYIERALAGKSVPLATAEEACHVDELMDAMYEAAGLSL